MTVTEPDEEATSPAVAVDLRPNPLTGVDASRVGRRFTVLALVFFAATIVVAAEPAFAPLDGELEDGPHFLAIATPVFLLFFLPAWIGTFMAAVPRQVGGERLALPRLASLATWIFAAGGVLALSGYAVDNEGALLRGFSSTAGEVLSVAGSRAFDLWITGIGIAVIGLVLGAVVVLATVAHGRAPGVALSDLPVLSWTAAVVSALSLIVLPVLIAGIALVHLDAHFGGTFFASEGLSAPLWQSMLWIFGTPVAFLILIPILGVMTEVVESASGRGVAAPGIAKALIVLTGVLSLLTWTGGRESADSLAVPTTSWASAAAVAPAGLLVLLWIFTFLKGKLTSHPPLIAVAAFVGLFALAVVHVAVAAIEDAGPRWIAGHATVVLYGIPLVGLVAAWHQYSVESWGASLSGVLARLEVLALTAAVVAVALSGYLAGYDETAQRDAFSTWSDVGSLVVAVVVLFVFGIVDAGMTRVRQAKAVPA